MHGRRAYQAPPVHALTLSLARIPLQTPWKPGIEIHVRCRYLVIRRNYEETWIELTGSLDPNVVANRRGRPPCDCESGVVSKPGRGCRRRLL